jgi:hypothetical protein
MSKSFIFVVCVLTSVLVLACGAPTNRNADAPAAATSPAGEQVGIAECDNFIAAYEACVSSKVPEAARANLRASVTTWRADWKKLANDPQTRGSLAAACQRQREVTITSMRAYNCAW